MKLYMELDQILTKEDNSEFTEDEMSAFLDKYIELVEKFGFSTCGSICRSNSGEV